MIVTTTNDIVGYRITQHLGVVRGLTVRSRSIIGNIGAGIQSLFGGNITIYTELAEVITQMMRHVRRIARSERHAQVAHAERRARQRIEPGQR